jgi:hypothetical protein
MPSLLRAFPAFVLLAIAIGSADNFADPDLWMHILEGRLILHTGHIPLYDTFSYSAAGLPWRNHEWLAQAILAFSYDSLGVFGLRLLKLLCTTAIVVALAIGLAKSAASLSVQRVLLVAAAAGIAPEIQFRPQMFTLAMLSILMATLAKGVYGRRDRLWSLVPMFALWANLHGGFVIGLAVLGIYSVTLGLWELLATGKVARAWRAALITVGCALATLLNPLGTGLWPNVLHSIFDPLIKTLIADWIPLTKALIGNWHTMPLEDLVSVVPLLLFLAFLVSLFAAPTMDDAPLVAVALAMIVAAFSSIRNIPLAVISLTIPLSHHLEPTLRRFRCPERVDKSSRYSSLMFYGAALLVATAGGLFSDRLKTWAPVPRGAVAFMEAHRMHGNILNFFSWGEYLIWHCAPASRVFIDGRTELVYPDRLLREYGSFLNGQPDGMMILGRYPHDFLLLNPKTSDYRSVVSDQRWKLVYRDSVSALFAKAGSPIARKFVRPASGSLQPTIFQFP